jgi:light-regulated signal transduction histidine kinase (bacteriophytochrome)
LLEFSRMNRAEIKKISFNVDSFVKNISSELIQTVHDASIEMKIHELPKGFGDPSLIRQVLVNLIGNAIKFSSHNAEPVVEIGGEENERETLFYVKDNGIGFDMKYADKLFGVFQRLHSQKEFEGTGVGLAIVQRIIQRHGGSVRAYGEPGKGATFTFTLPKQHMQLN